MLYAVFLVCETCGLHSLFKRPVVYTPCLRALWSTLLVCEACGLRTTQGSKVCSQRIKKKKKKAEMDLFSNDPYAGCSDLTWHTRWSKS
jgi:hypothetical protein